MLKNSSVFIAILLAVFAAKAQSVQLIKDPKEKAMTLVVDMLHLEAQLQFDTLEKKVIGQVTHSFKSLVEGLDNLVLDANAISVDSILFRQKLCQFTTEGQKLKIGLNDKLSIQQEEEISIYYHCKPRSGLYFVGFEGKKGNVRSQIWTQGQGRNNFNWIPLVDAQNDKVTTAISIDFDANYTVVSNGVLTECTVLPNGLKRWKYELNRPHSTYLMMLGIGKYNKTIVRESNPEISYHYYPEFPETERATFSTSDDLLTVLETFLGVPFPWNTYTQLPVQNYFFGAMENTTATIFGDFFLTDSLNPWTRSFTEVSAHEFGHQWFGDYVTGETSTHQWIQEGFATYLSWIYRQQVEGEWAYTEELLNGMNQVFAASARDTFPLMHTQAGSGRHYYKAAWVLHMLRDEMGADAFQKSIQHFLKEHAYSNTTTKDLQTAFQRNASFDLGQFFQQWVYQPCEPILLSEIVKTKKEQKITISQVQRANAYSGLFSLNIEVWVGLKSGQIKKYTTRIFDQSVDIQLDPKDEIEWHFVNPDLKTLAKVFIRQSDAAWKSLLFHPSATPYMQLIALFSIEKNRLSSADVASIAAMVNRSEVPMLSGSLGTFAAQLNSANLLADSIFKGGNNVSLIALLNTWEQIPEKYHDQLFSLLKNPAVELRLEAFNAIQRSFKSEVDVALQQLSMNEIPNTFKVQLAVFSAKQRFFALDATEKTALENFATSAYDVPTRVAALDVLKQEKTISEDVVLSLLEGAFHFHSSMMRKSREVLKIYTTNGVIDKSELFLLAKQYFKDEPARVDQLETIIK